MSWRQFYLRLMLVSLATATAGGAISVLFLHSDATWRVIITALVTGVSASLMLPASTLAAVPERKAASNLAMGMIVLEFILILLAVWIPGSDSTANLLLTVLVVFATAMPAIILLGTFRQPGMIVAAPIGLVLCAVSLLLFLVATWKPVNSFSFDNWPICRTAWLFYLFMLLATGALFGLNPKRPATFWRLIGIAAAAAAFWRSFYTNFNASRVGPGPDFISCENLAILIAYISLALPVPLPASQTWVRKLAIYAVAATGILITLNSFAVRSYSPQFARLDRLTAAAGIIAGCATIAQLLLSQINQTTGQDVSPAAAIHQITIICPRCRGKSTLPMGPSACPRCGLAIGITVSPDTPLV